MIEDSDFLPDTQSTAARADAAALVGRRLGHYEVVAVLGRGAGGEVYRARDVVLGREVALKALPAALAAQPQVVARLDREARILASLNHPNIATLYSLDSAVGADARERRFLVLELVGGEDLGARLQRGALRVDEALRVAAQIARALEAAHAKGIVHRDLKPANVMLGAHGAVKVLDFGVAKVRGERPAGAFEALAEVAAEAPAAPPDAAGADRQALTEAGSLTGTIPYMSPEQLRSEPADPRSDIWAFACVLFECLAGERAFGRARISDTFAAILRGEPPWLLLPAATPPAVRQLLERCLHKDAAARLQQIASARLTLEHALGAHAAALPAPPSLAVLPFTVLGAQPGGEASPDQYFGDGLAEELIHSLTRLPGLKVASRSSAFHLGGAGAAAPDERALREIGARLGVAAVLEGTLRRADRRLRVSVRLINVADGYVAWSERYDRELADVFAVQDEITAAIVAALEPALRDPALQGPTAAPRLAASAVGLEAYELYLQGRHCWHQRAPGAVRAGIECFERAARLDPSYARAYTGIADSYGILRAYGALSWADGRGPAKQAAERALALDPTLAEAHLSIGMFHFHYDEEWALAEPSFRKAIEINPCSSLAQVYYGLYLAVHGGSGQAEAALTQTEIARDLDPLSPFIHALSGLTLLIDGRYDAALAAADRTLELQAEHPLAMAVRGLACCKLERWPQAVATLERLVAVSRRSPVYVGMLGLAYGLVGRSAEALALADELAARELAGYVSPHCDLLIQAGLGDRAGVERALQRCREDHTSKLMIAASAGPFLDPLAGEQRRQRPGEPTSPFGLPPRASASAAGAVASAGRRVAAGLGSASGETPTGAGRVGDDIGERGRLIAGKYRLLAELGRGGMGVVYRAEDTFIHRQVAVKLLQVRDDSSRERLRERMHREVIITGRLAHPQIVTLHDAGVVDDEMYLVMELVAGEDLRARLRRDGALPPAAAVGLVLQMLDALAYAHGQGVIHRDLKPANVLVDRAGRVKVVDFGIAKLRSLATADDTALPAGFRQALTAGHAVGTLGYMAPEQILDQAIDERVDIYSLGALLYELLSGEPLSEHVTPLARAEALLAERPGPAFPSPLPATAGDAGAALSAVVARALSVRPADRQQSSDELAAALRALRPLS